MYINNLTIKNFRNFREFSIDFHRNVTVLVANNSAGKTSILDAVSIAISPYIAVFPLGKSKGFIAKDASIFEEGDEPLYPVFLEAAFEIDLIPCSISRTLSKKSSSTTTVDTKPLQNYAKKNHQALVEKSEVQLPIVAYYGTGRLWNNIKVTKTSKESHARSYGYHDCLKPASNFKEFEKWFIENSLIEYSAIIEKIESGEELEGVTQFTPNTTILKNVKESVNIALADIGWKNLKAVGSTLYLENKNNVKLPIDVLSDGVKSMLALVADIAYRCTKLNPTCKNALTVTEGIVLIDEVDMHLHPSWQQKVLRDLTTIFPKIQFIITTHSPQVLSSVKDENIRIIDPKNSKAKIPFTNPYGKQSIVALEDIMDVDARPPKEVVQETELLENYLRIIHQGDIDNPDLPTMRQTLEAVFGNSYRKLMIADMVINKHKAKKAH